MNDCARVAEYLETGGAPGGRARPPEVEAHLRECPACRRLVEFAADAEVSEVSAEAEERIRQSLLSQLEPVSPLPSRWMLALGFLGIFAGFSLLILGGSGAAAAPIVMGSAQLLGLLAAIVVCAGAASLWMSGEMTPGEKRWTGPGGLIAYSLLALGLATAVLLPWEISDRLWAGSWKCFKAAFLLSIPVAAPVVWLMRRGLPSSPRAIGVSTGVLAGLVGVFVLHLKCPVFDAPHIAIGHLTTPLAGAAVGYLAGRLAELRRARTAEV